MNAKLAEPSVSNADGAVAASRQIGSEATSFTTHVAAIDGNGFLLSNGMTAQRAASCLLRPEIGDFVLCARTGLFSCWILAVLVRESTESCTLETPGAATLAANGPLTLQGESLNLHATESTTLRTPNFEAALDTAHVAGRELHLFAGTMKLVGSVLSSAMDRIQQFSRQYLRHTEALDRVSAAQVQVEAKQILQLHGEQLLVEGENLVKTRGSQIHFG